ncbi:hypothetical protein BDZ45DRAFT_741846 [Acephala macrosclerotiorum]|nr:hypothetical protein BDZ45DRAFT_741846 [Acephala macrosclerotiorum]
MKMRFKDIKTQEPSTTRRRDPKTNQGMENSACVESGQIPNESRLGLGDLFRAMTTTGSSILAYHQHQRCYILVPHRTGARTEERRYEPSSPIATVLTVLINILCVSASVDFVYRGQIFHQSEKVTFSRVGYVDKSIDNWAGYLVKRQIILKKIWKTERVVVISGDRHEHPTTKFPAPDGNSNVVEFSTSPLSQFYQPFDRQYRQEEESDVVMMKYHPFGVSKFGVFNFDTSNATNGR